MTRFTCKIIDETPVASIDDDRLARLIDASRWSETLHQLLIDAGAGIVDAAEEGQFLPWKEFCSLATRATRSDALVAWGGKAMMDAFASDPTQMKEDDLYWARGLWTVRALYATAFPDAHRFPPLTRLTIDLATSNELACIPDAPGWDLDHFAVRVLGDLQPDGHRSPVQLYFSERWGIDAYCKSDFGGVGEDAVHGIALAADVPFQIQTTCGEPEVFAGRTDWWTRNADVVEYASNRWEHAENLFFAATLEILVHDAWLPARGDRHQKTEFPLDAWFR